MQEIHGGRLELVPVRWRTNGGNIVKQELVDGVVTLIVVVGFGSMIGTLLHCLFGSPDDDND